MPLEGEGLVGSPSVRASALCRTLGLQATVDSVAVPRCQSRLKCSADMTSDVKSREQLFYVCLMFFLLGLSAEPEPVKHDG